MSEWTREHDRTLAEKCEGMTNIPWDNPDAWSFEDGNAGSLPHYNTDIAACFRAAEAWRLQANYRRWIVESPFRVFKNTHHRAIIWGALKSKAIEHGDTACAALAQALHEAVKDA